MYNILKHAHSGLRWLVLLFLVLVIVHAFTNWRSDKSSSSKMPLIAMSIVHLQFVLGLILYFISPLVQFSEGWMKDSVSRFYGMEHILMMVIAVIIISVGYSTSKKRTGGAKFKRIFWTYLIGLLIILSSIPWPFRGLGGNWF